MPTLVPGQHLGPYTVVSPLGAGGMGEVYRARDSRLARDVAVKVLPADVADDPARRRRFEHEARAVAALSHPNVVAVFDVGDDGGVVYIVSELVDGESLRGVKFGLRKIVETASQIAAGLAAAHAAGIVHRDLKPDNVLLTRAGCVKILDFGLAKTNPPQLADHEATETLSVRTEPGVVMGTIAYMSPEQVSGITADHRSDIFSFGVLLYELLAGTRPFQGETPVDTMQAILRKDPPELTDAVPVGLRQIVQHCLEKDPGKRFQSAQDLGFALSQAATVSGAANMTAPPPAWRKHAKTTAAALVLAGLSLGAGRLLWPPAESQQWSGVLLGGPEMAISPRPSPDGHLLGFLAMVDGQTQVALMIPESGNWSILTHKRDRGLIPGLTWSADGAVIYYSRATEVPHGVYSIPALGGEERLLLADASQPEGLPDGSLVIVKLNSRNQRQLFRFRPENGQLQALPLLVPGFGFDANIRVMPGGAEVAVLGRPVDQPDQPAGLFAIDPTSGAFRRLTPATHPDETMRAMMVSRDGGSILAATPADRMMRISSMPTRGRFRERTLFTATSDVWAMDGAPDGSVYLGLADRPAELVRLSLNGESTEIIARHPAVAQLDMILVLPDGRTVFPSATFGHTRLMALEKGRDPVALANTPEETAAPMTVVGPRAIGFMIGPVPHQTIAVADVGSGRVERRIAPGKGRIDSLMSSPDGKTLYFVAGGSLWIIPADGGEARRIGTADSAAMDPSGHTMVLQRRENSRLRLFRLSLDGGQEQEIPMDGSVPLFSPFLSPGALDGKGRLLVSLNPTDSWFCPPGLVDIATGRITRIPASKLSDYEYPVWTADGHVMALQLGLQASIWKFRSAPKAVGRD